MSSAVAELADPVWQYRLEVEPFARVKRGLPVESRRRTAPNDSRRNSRPA